jgi:elongation factor G
MSAPAHIGLIRNFGVLAHVDAGKTTTTERILALTDRSPAEAERGITLTSAATSCEWRGHRLNIVDLPSSAALSGEARRALKAIDGAVALIDAGAGIEPQLEALWRLADEAKLARIVFVNKMDRADAEFAGTVAAIGTRLGATPLVLTLPFGAGNAFEGVIDLVAGRVLTWRAMPFGAAFEVAAIPAERAADAAAARIALVEAVGATDTSTEGLAAAVRAAVLAGRGVAVLAGSAFRNKGLQPLLDAVVDYLPSPDQVAPLSATEVATGAIVVRPANDGAPLVAFAFRATVDPVAGPLVFARVFSGVIEAGVEIENAGTGRRERAAKVLRFEAADRVVLAAAGAGDIVALAGLGDTHAGDTLTAPGHAVLVEPRSEQARSKSA